MKLTSKQEIFINKLLIEKDYDFPKNIKVEELEIGEASNLIGELLKAPKKEQITTTNKSSIVGETEIKLSKKEWYLKKINELNVIEILKDFKDIQFNFETQNYILQFSNKHHTILFKDILNNEVEEIGGSEKVGFGNHSKWKLIEKQANKEFYYEILEVAKKFIDSLNFDFLTKNIFSSKFEWKKGRSEKQKNEIQEFKNEFYKRK